MVALRTAEVEAFLARPDLRRPLVLVYGPDAGLVRERVDGLLAAAGGGAADPFCVVRVEGDTLAGDPARLNDEARTIGLFGDRRVVHVRAGSRNFLPAVEAVLADPPEGVLIVIEAGDLRRESALRRLAEASRAATAIPCYADDERGLARLIDRALREAGFAIDPDAREALIALLGADRLATRAELDKLVLYAKGRDRITYDDVRAAIADASALALDDVVDAAAAGEPDAALAAFAKARAAGTQPGAVVGAAIRHVATLHRLSLRVEGGEHVRDVVEKARPTIHFRRRPRVERALARFRPDELARALAALGDAGLATRRSAALADAIAEQAILGLAGRSRAR